MGAARDEGMLRAGCEKLFANGKSSKTCFAADGQELADLARLVLDERTEPRPVEDMALGRWYRRHNASRLTQHIHRAFGIGGELRFRIGGIVECSDLDHPVSLSECRRQRTGNGNWRQRDVASR